MENIIRGTLESSVEDGLELSISIHHPLDPQEREFSGRIVVPHYRL